MEFYKNKKNRYVIYPMLYFGIFYIFSYIIVTILKIMFSILFLASGLICAAIGIFLSELFFIPIGIFLLLVAYLACAH